MVGKLDILFFNCTFCVILSKILTVFWTFFLFLDLLFIADSMILMYLKKLWGFYTNILLYFNKKNLKPKPIYYFLTGFQKLDQLLQWKQKLFKVGPTPLCWIQKVQNVKSMFMTSVLVARNCFIIDLSNLYFLFA